MKGRVEAESLKEPLVLWVTAEDLGLKTGEVGNWAKAVILENGETAVLIFLDVLMKDLWRRKRLRKQYLQALKDTLSFVLIHELVHLYSGVLHDTKIDGLTRILAQLIY
jgi:hypothetical protein